VPVDSLTVREERRLQALRREHHAARGGAQARREVLAGSASPTTSTACPPSCRAASGGRVAIARAMAFKPRILLYDEATTGLDPITATRSTRRSSSSATRARELDPRDAPAARAFYVATHMASATPAHRPHRAGDPGEKSARRSSSWCRDGMIVFEATPTRCAHRPIRTFARS